MDSSSEHVEHTPFECPHDCHFLLLEEGRFYDTTLVTLSILAFRISSCPLAYLHFELAHALAEPLLSI
jgi:hypothetical protein